MSRTGYECGRCGYEPSQDELNRGTCPECFENDRIDEPREIAQMNALPLGGTVDVLKKDILQPHWRDQDERSSDPSRKTWWTTQALARWRCVEIRRDGTRLFTNVSEVIEHEARDCYEESQRGTGTVRTIRRRVSRIPLKYDWIPRDHWTAEDIHGWYCWERTYGAWLVIKDNLPSPRDLARERIAEGVGMAA